MRTWIGLAALAAFGSLAVCEVAAHEIKWSKGEPRQAYFGACAKGACAKRVAWAERKPHRHVDGKIVFDRSLRRANAPG